MKLDQTLTTLDKGTIQDRLSYLLYYLIKPGFYTAFTKPKIDVIANWASGIPLIGVVGSVLNDYSSILEKYHFYSTGF